MPKHWNTQREDHKNADDVYENIDAIRGNLAREIDTGGSNTTRSQPSEVSGSDYMKILSYIRGMLCLVLLCVLLLTAVIVLSVHISTQSKNYAEERHQLLINNTNLIHLNERFQQVNNELWNFTQDGWIYYRFSFYSFFTQAKSWNESRRICIERGADLLVINSKMEQDFVRNISSNNYVWIGLTGDDSENSWKWIDNSRLTFKVWGSREPSGKGVGNCVVTASSLWAVRACNSSYYWICEKSNFTILKTL